MNTESFQSTCIRVGIVESDPLRLIGLRTLLDAEPDIEIGVTCPSEFREQRVNIVLVRNRTTPSLFDVIEELEAQHKDLRVLVTGSATDDDTILKALTSGAKGYLSEAASAHEFALAIRMVSQGVVWVPRRVIAKFIDRFSPTASRWKGHHSLTCREKQILAMLVEGRSNKQIAAPLGIEERTVKAHVSKLLRKVGAQNRVELSVRAVTDSLV